MKHFLEAHPNTQLAYGAIEDDRSDHRPGTQAASKHNAVAPLQLVLLYKSEIRQLSSARGLPTAEKASFACLGSRFHGYPHQPEKTITSRSSRRNIAPTWLSPISGQTP